MYLVKSEKAVVDMAEYPCLFAKNKYLMCPNIQLAACHVDNSKANNNTRVGIRPIGDADKNIIHLGTLGP